MKFSFLKTAALLCFLIFFFLFVTSFWTGLHTQPTEGDSLSLHLPAAQAMLHGFVLQPHKIGLTDYPLASEMILAVQLFLHLPPNVYNVFALAALFVTLYFLGKRFAFSKSYAVIFASSVCSLYGVLRYVNTQQIDIWLLVFFALSVYLLEKPQKKLTYFLTLGFSIGMVIGSKYSGPFFALILLVIYVKGLIKTLTKARFLIFLLPLTIFGLSWYIRNIINTGDPFFPQNFLFFKGDPTKNWYAWQYWQVALLYPSFMFNALISEFMIWTTALIIVPPVLVYKKFKQKIKLEPKKIIFLAASMTLVFLWLPPPPLHSYTSVVFGMRYGFPAILSIILLLFIFAKEYKKEILIASIALANLTYLLLPIPYHPKLLFIYVPVVTFLLLVTVKLFKKYSVVQ